MSPTSYQPENDYQQQSKMKQKISFYTFGCRLNQSETAVIQNSFTGDNYTVVDFNQPADIVVINTCTVTENGDADTKRLVNKINRVSPTARIALIGCQAQIQKEKLTQLPNVRWVIGNGKKMDLRSIFDEDLNPAAPQVIAPTIERQEFTMPFAGIDRHLTRANIKIQDGCDDFCSFCEIPYARGRARSRKFDDILAESQVLVAAGYKEIILTGINLGTYSQNKKTITDVVTALEQIDGLERIRISSIEPTTIPLALIKKMVQQSKLCRYLHIPLQSGNTTILKLMGRKYTSKQYGELIQKIHESVPEVCLGTDVIVGFPGETRECFQETVENLRQWPVNYFHVFSYSQRSMAKSKALRNKISVQEIQQRSETLRGLSQRKRRLFHQGLLGTTQKVLFEEAKNDYWFGLTDNYIRVKVQSDKNLTNCLLKTKLTALDNQAVTGSLSQ